MKRALSLLFVFATYCASTPNQPATAPVTLKAGNYSADMGPSPVGVIPSATLHDAQRNKDLDVSIEYPTRGGPFPVIVFSHSYGSRVRDYEPLISYWTSNGYVCIRPAHADAGLLRDTSRDITNAPPPSAQQGRRRPEQQQGQIIPLQVNNPAEQIWDREREPQWQNRVADMKLVIDSLSTLERQFPELIGKLDQAKIGVGGHGYGAFTALLVGGLNGSPDPRVKAIVVMSPPGPSTMRGITTQSFASIKLAAMFMTGTNDRGGSETEDVNWRKQGFENTPAGDKELVVIDSARSSSFTGQIGFFDATPMTMPTTTTDAYGRPIQVQQPVPRGAVVFGNDRRIFQIVKITSLAFWDAYLKSDTAARDLLQPQKYDEAFTSAHLTVK